MLRPGLTLAMMNRVPYGICAGARLVGQRLPSNRSIRPALRCLLPLIALDRAEQLR